jgi:hypothetical protein
MWSGWQRRCQASAWPARRPAPRAWGPPRPRPCRAGARPAHAQREGASARSVAWPPGLQSIGKTNPPIHPPQALAGGRHVPLPPPHGRRTRYRRNSGWQRPRCCSAPATRSALTCARGTWARRRAVAVARGGCVADGDRTAPSRVASWALPELERRPSQQLPPRRPGCTHRVELERHGRRPAIAVLEIHLLLQGRERTWPVKAPASVCALCKPVPKQAHQRGQTGHTAGARTSSSLAALQGPAHSAYTSTTSSAPVDDSTSSCHACAGDTAPAGRHGAGVNATCLWPC